MSSTSSEPELGREYIPPEEAGQIEMMLGVLREIQERHDRRERPVKRDLHPKQHACLRADLEIDDNIPAALKHGLFRTPHVFPALVRFSSAKMRDDRLPDAHGMSVKLLDVDGTRLMNDEPAARTHDFILVDHPVFFARDVADMVPLIHLYRELMLGGVFIKSRTIVRATLSLDRRFRIMRAMVLKMPSHLLSTEFWSTTPVKIGSAAVKFRLHPETNLSASAHVMSSDRLRLRLAAHLRERTAQFALLAQMQKDPVTMPIEDATICWDEKRSPFIRVATLRIPRQTFDAPEQMALGERLSFTPWHGLAEHRPLGGINRARREIYQSMARHRRELNGVAPREPTLAEVEELWRDRV